MTLTLYYHPLASFCHKVLIALYESETVFDPELVDLMDPGEAARFLDLWPVGKMPVLRDEARDRVVAESSIIIEYLDTYHPGSNRLLPEDAEVRLDVRLWDRFFDLYVQQPMQKIVLDRLRPAGASDATGVEAARASLAMAYDMIDAHMRDRDWTGGDAFSMADCSAFPALFFAGIVEPFPDGHRALAEYFERLLARSSVQRVLDEARPYFDMFPYRDRIPDRFLR
jgi:glutathione S-transferase